MDTLTPKLKIEVEKLKKDGVSESSTINHLKEYLQIATLNYIYNSKKYSSMVMYGGSVLRICHDLPRMSEDLDFQTNKKMDIKEIAKDIEKYYESEFGFNITTTVREGNSGTKTLYLKFLVVKELELSGVTYEKIKLRIDINFFDRVEKFKREKRSIVKDKYSFLINTYTLSTLMASKIVAILRRKKRNIKGKESQCKPRDIYDLLWYLDRKIVPNMEYIKGFPNLEEYTNVLKLFDAVSLRVSNFQDDTFEDDLASFFYNPAEFQAWFRDWRVRFVSLISGYSFIEVGDLVSIGKGEAPLSENIIYWFRFDSSGNKRVRFSFTLSDYWFIYKDSQISSGHRDSGIEEKVENKKGYKDLDFEYIGLFYKKIQDYLSKNERVISKTIFNSKVIRTTADKLNVEKQILLNKRTIEKVSLEDLMI